MSVPSSPDGLLLMIEQTDEKHDAAHRRLRIDLDRLEEQLGKGLQSLREAQHDNAAKIDAVSSRPVEAAKLVLTPGIVSTIVVVALSIAGGVWASNSGLRSDVRDIITKMEAQQQAAAANARFQDAQTSSLRNAVDDMKRRMELQQYEFQQLKETVLTKGRTR